VIQCLTVVTCTGTEAEHEDEDDDEDDDDDDDDESTKCINTCSNHVIVVST